MSDAINKHLPAIVKASLTSLLLLSTISAQASCVILLHGLARTENSMSALQQSLQLAGYNTVNIGYPSRDYPIEILATIAIEHAIDQCAPDSDIYFVTHSLGGILVRQYLSSHALPKLKRVVMLGPPNHGSEAVDKLAGIPGFNWLNGSAGKQLSTDDTSTPNTLGPANFDVGIIAGNQSISPILSGIIPGKDDGKVSVNSTKLAGMNDHIELPTTHTFMMQNETVIEQVIHYLRNGQFYRPTDKPQPEHAQ